MNNFNTTSTKFYNELRNGNDFLSNPLDFTNELICNVQEVVQVIKVIQVDTSVLAVDFGTFDYTHSGVKGKFNFTGNWFNEGISIGATVDIIWSNGSLVASEQILNITGTNGGTLVTSRTNLDLQGLVENPRSDFQIKVTSAPNRIKYKYALNQLTATTNNYISPFDTNEQAYYLNNITGSYQTLNRIGNDVSWDLGQVEVKFNGTTNSYIHEFEVKHTFKIPYYVDGQISNIDDLLTPTNLTGTNSFKYGFGLFLAENDLNYNRVLEDVGLNGSVGYLNENFNGFINNYEIQNLVYTNDHGTDTLEGTDDNTLEFDIIKNDGNWPAGQKIVLKHSKLPTAGEYQNKTTDFDTIWMIDSLEGSAGAPPPDSTILTGLSVSVATNVMHVSIEIAYTVAEQLLIDDTTNWLLSVVVADESITPNDVDRVTLKVDSNKWGFDTDVLGLVQNNDIRFFKAGEEIVVPTSSEPTDFRGWDADFIGLHCSFQTNAQMFAFINSAKFKLIADNGSNTFLLNEINIPLGLGNVTNPDSTVYPYQLVNSTTQNQYNISQSESFNIIQAKSVRPPSGTVWQDWTMNLAFKVSWREWIENLDVDNVFYDDTKVNNNLNYKTSNYSNLEGYKIYGIIELLVNDTIYNLYSHESSILDFDQNGLTAFTGTVNFYDINNNLVDNVYNNENVRIEIDFDHAIGVIPKVEGEIIIEPVDTTNQEWRLSTKKDWTNPINPLQPIVGTEVTIVSISNKVTLSCNTNNINLVAGIQYNVYGKIY